MGVFIMDVLIVDDEPLARQRLRAMVCYLGCEVVGEANNGEAAMAAIMLDDPAVVLLDVEMPGENGLQLAARIAQLDVPPALIFTTAYGEYALDAFDTLAAGYLLKPIQYDKLEAALNKAQTLTKPQLRHLESGHSRHEYITSKSHRGMELIPVNSIRYFMADQRYVWAIGTQGKALIDGTLKELEIEFAKRFIRIHRNALVSIKHITGLDRNHHYYVRLTDVEAKPMVSRRYASKIKALIEHL